VEKQQYFNLQHYHENLKNVTPSDIYFGQEKANSKRRVSIKKRLFEAWGLQHHKIAAKLL